MSELSYLEKLLDGVEVEWKPLKDVCDFKNGFAFKSSLFKETGLPIVRITNIDGFNVDLDEVKYFSLNDYKEDLSSFEVSMGNILIAMSGATTGKVGIYKKGTKCYLNQRVGKFIPKENILNNNYLYHFLLLNTETIYILAGGGAQPNLSSNALMSKLLIPIPCPDNPEKSLAIQSEIVRILDKFTALTAELTAELNMRKKQYNYYRDQLLSFDESSVEWKTLLEACDYVDYRGKTPKKTQSGIFLVTAKNIRMGYIDYHASQEFISEEDYAIVMRRGLPKKGDVLITTEAPCGFVAQVNRENIALAQRVIKYRSKNTQLSNSFLKHYLLGSQFQDKLMQAATGSTVKGIKGSRLHQLKIPIPSKVEQDRIVAILDKFDTLTNSITEGLPREIELRQKQYEYYRDLLFSFPKPETVSN
ncbi:restriction endonuclease subunit S [Escherichia coli]|nr:restriction endonuclease subunit S [Escherichia coli]HBB9821481.1 restriction endonuclease subunit S [Escherichia coli]HBB9830553.1 restriction endonuclease subunit S [Escherichia coli]HBB9835466.1 restriction endonuclease subunit S [Escherichia coli]